MSRKHSNITVPRAMFNGKLKSKATECPDCGAPVYRYKGAYQKRCPNCGGSLRVLGLNQLKRRPMDKAQVESLINEIVGNNLSPGQAAQKALGIEQDEHDTEIINNARTKVAMVGMLDSYVGDEFDSEGGLKLYFGKGAKPEDLKGLFDKLAVMNIGGQDIELSMTIQKVDDPPAEWMVWLRRPTTGQPQVQGTLGVQGPASGEVSVGR